MRIDPKHAAKRRGSVSEDAAGRAYAKIDIAQMHTALMRLSSWERGILTTALLKSVAAKRPTLAQRALLALFLHEGDDHG